MEESSADLAACDNARAEIGGGRGPLTYMLVANYGTRRIVWVLTGCHTVNLVQGQAVSDISTILVLALPGVDAVSTSVSNGAMWRPRFDLLRILVWFRLPLRRVTLP